VCKKETFMLTVLLFFAGAGILIAGAEMLVRGATRLAAALGTPPLVIGLTVVAFGTSAPEVAVSIDAALQGHGDVALGNAIGSNIFNVLFILGLSALISPLVVAQRLVWWDVPVMIGVAVLAYRLGLDGTIGRWDGVLLCAGLVAYTLWAIRFSRTETPQVQEEYAQEFTVGQHSTPFQVAIQMVLIGSGLTCLIFGARWLVQGAVYFAAALGLSQLVISLTIVAAGTSLPEVATSVLAAIQGERDIAVGNVVGSNIFNILAVLGIGAAVAPTGIPLAPAALRFDMPVMLAVLFACLPIFFTGHRVARWEGALFVGYYLAYTVYLLLDATAHDALPVFSWIMLVFIMPLTVITLGIGVARALYQHYTLPRSTPDV
jgi:cation:H+ antiporter